MTMLPEGPIARATVRTSFVLSLRLGLLATTLLLLAYLLGPDRFGAFAAVVALAVLLGGVATFGTHLTLLRDLTRSPIAQAVTLPAALGTTLLCGGVLFLAYLLLSLTLLRSAQLSTLVVVCMGVSELLIQPFLLLSATQRHAKGLIATSQLLITVPHLLRAVLLVWIWVSSAADPLSMYAVGHVVAVLLSLCASLCLLKQPWPPFRSWQILNYKGFRDNSAFALTMLTANGPTEVDKIAAAHLLQTGPAGLYIAASRVITASIVPILSLMVSALPRLFRVTDARHPDLVRWLFVSTLSYSLVASAALYASAHGIEWAFGTKFIGVADNIRLLTFALFPMCLRIAATNTLMARGGQWLRVAIEAIGIALLLALAFLLVPLWATTGLIVAVAAAETLMAIISWACIFRPRHTPTGTQPLPFKPI